MQWFDVRAQLISVLTAQPHHDKHLPQVLKVGTSNPTIYCLPALVAPASQLCECLQG